MAKTPGATTATTPGTQAHRGYLICSNPFNGLIWIERDGYRISYAASVEAAKVTIAELIEWAPANPDGKE